MVVSVWVPGVPIQQGSMIARLIYVGGKPKAIMHSHNSAGLKAWRSLIAGTVMLHRGGQVVGPYVCVSLTFYMPRPKTTKYPDYPAGTPDVDKLTRAVLDALTESGVIEDDARVVRLRVDEEWASPEMGPGLAMVVEPR